jgi:hypothetical protein
VARRSGLAGRDEEITMQDGGDERLGQQRLAALFAAGMLLLNFPLLALWDRGASWLGLPLFPLALFGLWALLIGLLAWILESRRR